MQVGKLPVEVLRRLLNKLDLSDPRVLVGPKVGEDAAVIDYGRRLLVAKTDPITFATDLIGWYAVHINANDVATMGAEPKWFMATVLLPPGTKTDTAENVFDQIQSACQELDITLIGGHTEITHDLPRPIVVGCLLGEVGKDKLVKSSGAVLGDSVVITKGIAIEGTSVLSREAQAELLRRGLTPQVLERAKDYLFSPGISVVQEALTACRVATVHAMHDPTEGGLSTGLYELAEASGVGLLVERERIPVLAECATVCQTLDLDPMGLLASGSLIVVVRPEDVPRLLSRLWEVGVSACPIGRVMPKDFGLKMVVEGRIRELPRFSRDELARFFGAGSESRGTARFPAPS